jgi:MinD-like ATPase involved in chromosome partitioning or flagellar assembly
MTKHARPSTEVIAFSSGKGGTGKTSVIAALGYALTYSGHRVLMIDTDRATDGFSLFILGPHGMSQVGDFEPKNTFAGIVEKFERTKVIDAQPRIINRSGQNDHDLSYHAIISTRDLYGDPASAMLPSGAANLQIARPIFQQAVLKLFQKLRSLHEYDYILVDTRGGFSFESTDVAAASDSFVLVTEATYTNFYQDRNLIDRISTTATEMGTKPLLRGIIVNKATEGPEMSFRQELTKEFRLRLEDTFPLALDLDAASVYKTQKIIYREAPASRFAYDSLQCFQQILKVVTSQWAEDRVLRWNEIVARVDAAIAQHNQEVEAEKKQAEERVAQFQALGKERDKLQSDLVSLRDAHEQEKSRQNILLEELKAQASMRDKALARDRERDQEIIRNERQNQERELQRLASDLQEMKSQRDDAEMQRRSLDRDLIDRERAVTEARYEAEARAIAWQGKKRLIFALVAFLMLLLVISLIYSYYSTQQSRALQTKLEAMQAELQRDKSKVDVNPTPSPSPSATIDPNDVGLTPAEIENQYRLRDGRDAEQQSFIRSLGGKHLDWEVEVVSVSDIGGRAYLAFKPPGSSSSVSGLDFIVIFVDDTAKRALSLKHGDVIRIGGKVVNRRESSLYVEDASFEFVRQAGTK